MRASQIAIAIAALGLSTLSASAACEVTHGSVAQVLANGAASHNEADCASATTVAGQGVTIGTQGAAITALQANDGLQDTALASLAATKADLSFVNSENAAQNTRLNLFNGTGGTVEAWATSVDTTNTNQDAVDVDHETRITDTEAVNTTQQATIDDHTGTLSTHTSQISDLQDVTASHETRLNAHDALLSEHAATLKNHGARLDEQEKGIAIAMAMPDTWLSDTEKFAVAGNVGFFGDEAALAFAGIARIDQNWSMNAGFGSDTGFKQFGGKVGVRAGW